MSKVTILQDAAEHKRLLAEAQALLSEIQDETGIDFDPIRFRLQVVYSGLHELELWRQSASQEDWADFAAMLYNTGKLNAEKAPDFE